MSCVYGEAEVQSEEEREGLMATERRNYGDKGFQDETTQNDSRHFGIKPVCSNK